MTHRNVLRAAVVAITLAVSCRVYDSSLLADDAGGAGTDGSGDSGATSGSTAGAQSSGGAAGLPEPGGTGDFGGEVGMTGQGGTVLPGIGGETGTAGAGSVATGGHSGTQGTGGEATSGAGGRSYTAGSAGNAGAGGSSGRAGGGTGGSSGSAAGGIGGSSSSAAGGAAGSSGRAGGGTGGSSESGGGGSSGSAAGGSAGSAGSVAGGSAAGGSGGSAGSAAGSAGMGGSAGSGGVVIANGCANLSVPLSSPTHKARFVITLTNKLNFSNATISMRFYVKAGVGGAIANYIQDSNFNLLKNTSPPKLNASTSWQTQSWKIADQNVGSTGIVVSDVARVGIEINAAPDSTWSNPTIVYVDSIAVSSPALSFSFDTNSTISPTPSKNDAPGQALWPNAYAEDTTTSNATLGWLASCP